MSRYTGGCWSCPLTACEQAGLDGQVPMEHEEWCLAYDFDEDYSDPYDDDPARKEQG